MGGKEAVSNSWPSTSLILFRYTFEYVFNGQLYKKSISSYCGGSLIDRQIVLTAAHCFLTDYSFSMGTSQIDIQILPNSFYPTYASMYTVYLGMHNITGVFDRKSSIDPGVAYTVKKFTRVIF